MMSTRMPSDPFSPVSTRRLLLWFSVYGVGLVDMSLLVGSVEGGLSRRQVLMMGSVAGLFGAGIVVFVNWLVSGKREGSSYSRRPTFASPSRLRKAMPFFFLI